MRLFIKVENGVAVDHPIQEDNFKQAFPTVDRENLPPNFANFIRREYPEHGIFEVADGPTYEWNGEAFEDTYTIRAMTEEEKAEKIKQSTGLNTPEGMVFNEQTLGWEHVIPPENDESDAPVVP